MDFGLSEEQRLLESTVRDFVARQVPIERIRKLRELGRATDPGLWEELAALGLAGILVEEEHGGSGLSLLDAALVAESLGHGLVPSPFLATAVMAPIALRELPDSGGVRWLGGIAEGRSVFGVAATELFSVREDAGVGLRDGRLHGKALMALDALEADFVLVPLDGGRRLALVSGKAPHLERVRLRSVDSTRCTSELVFGGVAPEALFEAAGPAVERMLDAGRIALAADTLGACEAMLEQAVSYARVRKQFGRPIGSFQAVKHLCAEMVAEVEPARSLTWYAAHSFDALPAEAPQLACHVLAHVSEIGRTIASVATQVHGGIGWTDEQNLHFWFKRIAAARHLLGSPVALRRRAAELQGLGSAGTSGQAAR